MSIIECRIAEQAWLQMAAPGSEWARLPIEQRKFGLGNHRFVVKAPAGRYVRVTLPWRRRDLDPENTGVRIFYTPDGQQPVNGAGSTELFNIAIESISREACTLVFEAPEAGNYELYYLSSKMLSNWWFPEITYYSAADMKPDEAWLAALPQADVQTGEALYYEARTQFDSFYPMELPMTQAERSAFMGGSEAVLVAESRLRPVRMLYELPAIWLERGDSLTTLTDTACANEHYVFQLALCAGKPLENIQVKLTDAQGNAYSPEDCLCFNLYGRDVDGNEVTFRRDAIAGEVLSLWCGVKLENLADSPLTIRAEVTAVGLSAPLTAEIMLNVTPEQLPNNGDNDLWRLSRLFWLNSGAGLGDDVIEPYTPVEAAQETRTIGTIGKKLRIGSLGLPEQITSLYNDEVQVCDTETELLSAPLSLTTCKDGTVLTAEKAEQRWTVNGGQRVTVEASEQRGTLQLNSTAEYEADGHIDVHISVTALEDGEYSFALRLPMRKDAAQYMMGMCAEGGTVPSWWQFKWSDNYFGNLVWLGGVRGGIQLKLMQEDDYWGQVTAVQPKPRMWYNDDKGRFTLRNSPYGDTTLVEGTTGGVCMKAGQTEMLHFHMIVTPFHPIDYRHHWKEHIYHIDCWGEEQVPDLKKAKSLGATMINLHQGSRLNENINYPFIKAAELKEEIDRAHEMGMRYKLYYTVRELSNYAPEIWALRALGDEVLSLNPRDSAIALADQFLNAEERAASRKSREVKKGGPWLQEHMPDGFVGAWHQFLYNGEYDCAIATQGVSRWHNYYLEGLKWLFSEVGVDGIYLDGIGYDRRIMKRVRRVMMESGKQCDLDIHSGNNHAHEYGYSNPASFYLEHLAYCNSIWLGEGYYYEEVSPAYWLVESSGIPFGLMGEMLHGGGNPWRGMVYGMTARLGWQQGGISTVVWDQWEKFGMTEARMLGYWHPECPVSVENDQVRATAYVKDDGSAMIAVGSWYPNSRKFMLHVNREQLGIEGDYELYAPAIPGVQEETTFSSTDLIPIEPNKGWLFLLKRK